MFVVLKIKKELTILKSIEFSEQSSEMSIAEQSQHQQQKPLEVLLLEKNRFLQNENTQIKNKLNELQEKNERLVRENSEQASMNMEQKTLIVQLEKDLMRAAHSNRQPQSPVDISPDFDFDTSLLTNTTSQESLVLTQNSSDTTEQKQQPDATLFNIVSSQRERFRSRVLELESENLSSKQQVRI